MIYPKLMRCGYYNFISLFLTPKVSVVVWVASNIHWRNSNDKVTVGDVLAMGEFHGNYSEWKENSV